MAEIYHDHENGYTRQQRRNTLKCERQLMLEKFLYAMKEDLADWLSSLMEFAEGLTADNFMSGIENGVLLCQHANFIQDHIEDYKKRNPTPRTLKVPKRGCLYKSKGAMPGSFIARDNVANFIAWCRELGISEVVIFESEDLVLRKNERSVVLTLVDVARKASKFGVRPPEIVKFEEEIELEIERDKKEPERTQRYYVLERDNDLDHLVQEVINQCTCPIQFPITKVGEGKYRVGQNTTLIFVRVMRNHVMVRVGGGWDTLEHYIEKHDPCRIQDRIESSRTPRAGQAIVDNASDSCSVCSTESMESNPYQTPRRTRRFSSNSTEMENDPNNDPITQSFRRANTDMGPFRYQSRKSKDDPFSSKTHRAVSLETELKDCSVYDSVNPSDSWLRRQLNEIKREKTHNNTPTSNKTPIAKVNDSSRNQKNVFQKNTRDRRYVKGDQIPSALPRPTFTTRSNTWSLNSTESRKFHESRATRNKVAQRTTENSESTVAKRRKSGPSDSSAQRPIRVPHRRESSVKSTEGAINGNINRKGNPLSSMGNRTESYDKIVRPRAATEIPRPQIHKSKTMDLPTTVRMRISDKKVVQPQSPRRGSHQGVQNRGSLPKTLGQHVTESPKPGTNGVRKKESLQNPTKQPQGSCRGS